jgi:Ca2+-binding RTX toxin-like protein
MSQNVVFIGVDGAQLEQYLLQGLQGEAQEFLGLDIVESYIGGEKGTASEQATSSGPGWSTLLTGVWTDQHGVTSNNSQPVAPEVDSIFERVDAALPDATIASIINWSDINTGHFSLEAGLQDTPGVIDIEQHGLSDAAVTNEAVNLIETVAPDFMFVHLDDVDGVGHNSGFGEEYDAALNTVSDQIGQILAAVEAREASNPDENWLVIVSTDHGRDPAIGSSHGGQTATERRTFIAANQDLGTFSNPVPATSVVTTILDFMNIDYALGAGGLQSGSLLEGAADPLPPTIKAFVTPQDNEARVALDADLTVTFSEAVQVGTGAITILRAEDDAVVATIDVTSGAVTIDGATATIALPANLLAETDYYVQIASGAFTDGVNPFFGINDKTSWNFSTEADLVAPEIVALTPADDSTTVPLDADLTIRFDEAVVAGAGNIVVRRAAVDSILDTIAITDPRVTIAGDTVTVDMAGILEVGTEYYVTIDAGALSDTSKRVTLFAENFETVPLDPFQSGTESGGDGTDFSATPPIGWTADPTTTPVGGPVEFFGWTVLDKQSWITSAGNQGRGEFTNASGAVLVADPDEYDDGAASVGPNQFNAYIRTPAIALAGVEAGTATVTFDSSWRAEGTQKAAIDVSYDGGVTWNRVMLFDSDASSPDFKADATNESVTVALDNPAGATEAIIRFGMFDAGNNWWWAVDDIIVQGTGSTGSATGNAFAGIDDETRWSFTTTPVDGKLVLGTNGVNVLMGEAGNDTMFGANGADSLGGGLGDDTIGGGNGNDTLDGGEGRDTLSGHGSDDLISGGAGDDLIFGGNGSDLVQGDAGDDTMDGGNGADVLAGGEGADRLLGRAGADTLEGGIGNDTLDGGGSRDVLAGGQGDDVLLGGLGPDIFAFGANGGSDIVLDFASREVIRLDDGITLALTEVALIDADDILDTVLTFSDGGSVTLMDFSAGGTEQIVFA